MTEAYSQSGLEVAEAYGDWPRFSEVAYQSATHGNRYVHNYASPDGADEYGKFEEIDRMPAGSTLAKDSFVANADGSLAVGPLFLMERLEAGANPDWDDWEYSMVMPDGTVQTGDAMQFCADCHGAVAQVQDSLMFLPEELRTEGR